MTEIEWNKPLIAFLGNAVNPNLNPSWLYEQEK